MWLWWMRATVAKSEGILVSLSVTEGAWSLGGAGVEGAVSSFLPPVFCLSGSVPKGKALLRFLPYVFF